MPDEGKQIVIDEQQVRANLAQRIGALTLDNEILISSVTLLQAENESLSARLKDAETQLTAMKPAEPVRIEPEGS